MGGVVEAVSEWDSLNGTLRMNDEWLHGAMI